MCVAVPVAVARTDSFDPRADFLLYLFGYKATCNLRTIPHDFHLTTTMSNRDYYGNPQQYGPPPGGPGYGQYGEYLFTSLSEYIPMLTHYFLQDR